MAIGISYCLPLRQIDPRKNESTREVYHCSMLPLNLLPVTQALMILFHSPTRYHLSLIWTFTLSVPHMIVSTTFQ
jgi:hypothetical protein